MGFFPLVFPQAAIAVPRRQAVLLCLLWPDGCRVVTRGFLGMAPGAARSQRKWRGAFCSVSGLLHKVGTASGFGTRHAWTHQAAGARSSNPRQTPSHPPCSLRADLLFGLSLSQCPDECGSCQHPPPRPASGGGLIWLIKGARVGLGGGTGQEQAQGDGNLGRNQELAPL